AAFGNFAAYGLVGLHVAETVGKGIINKDAVTPAVVFGALIGAMFWNVLTWVRGIPSSSSHALIGGLLGAGIAHAGFGVVESAGTTKTLVAIFLSPTIGFLIAMTMMMITSWLFSGFQPRRADGVFKVMHLFSSAAYSISHGANDAQKTMGVITVLLYSTGQLGGEFHVPNWVVISCYLAISLGTLSGGWKIIQTMGTKLTRLNHHSGFCASTAGSIVVFGASALGIPVSTTHAITGSVVGVGAAKRASAVRWGVASRVVMAWFITIPASAAVGALFYFLTRLF
ncbi:MAG: inorganic phosphate transporter, partial [Sphingopyxis sp.]